VRKAFSAAPAVIAGAILAAGFTASAVRLFIPTFVLLPVDDAEMKFFA